MEPPLFCGDPEIEALADNVSCCDSCHEDHKLFGMDLLERIIIVDGVERLAIVCCATAIEIDRKLV